MKLTDAEAEICKKHSAYDGSRKVHCFECPLVIDESGMICYANVDGRTKEAHMAKRYKRPHGYDPDRTPYCSNCKWWEEFNWICCNGDSAECAGTVAKDFCCEEWEEKNAGNDER